MAGLFLIGTYGVTPIRPNLGQEEGFTGGGEREGVNRQKAEANS